MEFLVPAVGTAGTESVGPRCGTVKVYLLLNREMDYFTIRCSVESRLRQLRQSLQKNCCLFRAMIIVLRLFSLLLSYWNAMLLSLLIAG